MYIWEISSIIFSLKNHIPGNSPGFEKLAKAVMNLPICIEFYNVIVKYFHYDIAEIFLESI